MSSETGLDTYSEQTHHIALPTIEPHFSMTDDQR